MGIDLVKNIVVHDGRTVADLAAVSEVWFRPGQTVEFVDGARRRYLRLSPFSIRNRRRRWAEFQREVVLRLADIQPGARVRVSTIRLRSLVIVPLSALFGFALLADWAKFGGARTLALGALLIWICGVVVVAVVVDLWRRVPASAGAVADRLRTVEPGEGPWPLGPSPWSIALVAGLLMLAVVAIVRVFA